MSSLGATSVAGGSLPASRQPLISLFLEVAARRITPALTDNCAVH